MKSRLAPNRAICQGDRARAGVGEPHDTAANIQQTIAGWTTPFLKTFIKTCKSDAWRKEVHSLILIREGIACDLRTINTKKARRNRRGSNRSSVVLAGKLRFS